jgi:hypothetical protein
MKKRFSIDDFIATYNEKDELWTLYRNNLKVGVIYDFPGSIRFTTDQESFDLTELESIRAIIKLTTDQYIKLFVI